MYVDPPSDALVTRVEYVERACFDLTTGSARSGPAGHECG
jgi:hypothetical protein